MVKKLCLVFTRSKLMTEAAAFGLLLMHAFKILKDRMKENQGPE